VEVVWLGAHRLLTGFLAAESFFSRFELTVIALSVLRGSWQALVAVNMRNRSQTVARLSADRLHATTDNATTVNSRRKKHF